MLLCSEYYPLVFKALFWTFNPRNKQGSRNIPFITWAKQDEAIVKLTEHITEGKSIILDKSRDEGASWIMMGVFFCFMMFVPDSNFLVGSRKEELVDRTGDNKTLFAKLVYLCDKLPLFCKPEVEKTHMHFRVKDTNSICDGEATNENFAAGDRRTAIGLDELGRVKDNIAQDIIDSIADVTDCVIYNSTHFYGRTHPYARLLYGGIVDVCVLGWEDNPFKNKGMYVSTDLNVIKLIDLQYWQSKYPDLFGHLKKDDTFKASEIEWNAIITGRKPYPFVADAQAAQLRCPWYDKQEAERSPRDLAMNVNRDPCGSSETFFDIKIINRAMSECRDADFQGEVLFDLDENEMTNIRFIEAQGRKRLRFWDKLPSLRPIQTHNYIVGCDISMGTGSSHSVASIYDVNTHTKVGSWYSSTTEPKNFAEQVVAICRWLGGQTSAFLIWESNGGQGLIFDRRVAELGYSNVYFATDERTPHRPDSYKRGWHSSQSSKMDMLSLYRNALYCRFTSSNEAFTSYDFESLRQCEDYVYLNASGGVGPSNFREADDGAKATHGDMVIADALCVLARNDQPRAVMREESQIKKNSMAERDIYYKRELLNQKDSKWNN